jgi:AP-1 complex subunit beta-1
VKIEAGAERCVNVLLDLIATRVSYVVQEAVVVMKVFSLANLPSLPLISVFQDIFRRYPSTYEGVIPTLCANLEELDEPEAKASLIWIIGEYANKIDNADELLGTFVDTFTEESYSVRAPFTFGHVIADPRTHVIGTAADAHRGRETLPIQA